MTCLKTPELNQEERDYAIDYCTTKNTYYVAPEEGIPYSDEERQRRQLGYYHVGAGEDGKRFLKFKNLSFKICPKSV